MLEPQSVGSLFSLLKRPTSLSACFFSAAKIQHRDFSFANLTIRGQIAKKKAALRSGLSLMSGK